MSEESITTSDNTFFSTLFETYSLPIVKFNGICLIRSNVYDFRKVINLYISYTLDTWPRDLNTDFTLNNCLFRSTELTKNADSDKYKYADFGIRYDSPSEFSLIDGSMGKSIIIFGADMSSSVHIDNKNKDI